MMLGSQADRQDLGPTCVAQSGHILTQRGTGVLSRREDSEAGMRVWQGDREAARELPGPGGAVPGGPRQTQRVCWPCCLCHGVGTIATYPLKVSADVRATGEAQASAAGTGLGHTQPGRRLPGPVSPVALPQLSLVLGPYPGAIDVLFHLQHLIPRGTSQELVFALAPRRPCKHCPGQAG